MSLVLICVHVQSKDSYINTKTNLHQHIHFKGNFEKVRILCEVILRLAFTFSLLGLLQNRRPAFNMKLVIPILWHIIRLLIG